MADELRRKREKPVASLSVVLKLVEEHWAIPSSAFTAIKALESYDDSNFFVASKSGNFLAKLYNGVETDNEPILQAQVAFMTCLAAAGIRTQTIVKTTTGDDTTYVSVPVTGGGERSIAMRLFKWVEGEPLVGKATEELLVEAGKLLGRLQCAVINDGFSHPGLQRYHQWDLRQTADLRGFVKHIADESRRSLVETVIDAFESEVLPHATELRTGPLQADFNDANIILPDGDGELGVIDYGDVVESWIVNDVAIGAAYATVSSFGKTDPLGAATAFLEGVAQELKLTELERRLLPILAACRLAISVTLGAYSYQQQPECTYLLLHAEPGWQSLETIWSGREERVKEMFWAATAS